MWKTRCRLRLSQCWTMNWTAQTLPERCVEFVGIRLWKIRAQGSDVDNLRAFHTCVENLV